MDLEARFARLESDYRKLKRLMVSGLILFCLVLFLGQARPEQPKQLTAQKFVVVDEEGRERASLGTESGGAQLALKNSEGQTVIRVQVPKVPDKAAIYLDDPELSSGVELAMTMNGPVLHLTDRSGTRVRLATNELNAPLAAVHSADGKLLFRVTADQ